MVDRRLWSISARGLNTLLEELLSRGLHPTSSRHLQLILKELGIYPARDFEDLCIPKPPHVFVTYHSAEDVGHLNGFAWDACHFAMQELQRVRPELSWDDLSWYAEQNVRLWVDWVFIDQRARDIRAELDALPSLLSQADAHFVLGERTLQRAWCCYEIGLFNSDGPEEDWDPDGPLLSFVSRSLHPYFNWELTEVSEPEDKPFIAEAIRTSFPRGFEGFTHVMAQASTAAILNAQGGSGKLPPLALERLAASAASWFDGNDANLD